MKISGKVIKMQKIVARLKEDLESKRRELERAEYLLMRAEEEASGIY